MIFYNFYDIYNCNNTALVAKLMAIEEQIERYNIISIIYLYIYIVY